ncbi:dolichyl-diphosphooligosaccharide--protein glycosyltransferase subunit DAD1 isoform X1 [Eretmochelys imbricata]
MSGAAAAGGGGSVGSVVRRFLAEYSSGTASRLKVLDAYLLYVLLSGALQFGYCLGVGTFPFNSFLSGFISAVGSFILGGPDYLSWSADAMPRGQMCQPPMDVGPAPHGEGLQQCKLMKPLEKMAAPPPHRL